MEWVNVVRKLSDLQPWERNPRQINETQAERLKESFEDFGQVETIAIGPGNEVYNGHQRLNVLMKQHGGEYEIECRQSDRALTEKEREKLTVFLHKGAAGEWDWDILANEFEMEDLLDWGFEEGELFGFEKEPSPAPEPRIDEAEQLLEKWNCETGQLWRLGEHMVLCDDSTDKNATERLMDGQLATMCLTDPPYNIDYGSSKMPHHRLRKIEGDNLGAENWREFVEAFGQRIKETTTGDVYVWGASGREGMRMRLWLIEMGLHWSTTIIWVKQHFVFSPAKYQRKYEMCLYGWYNKSSFVGPNNAVDIWEIDRPFNSKYHPTMKPVELCATSIANSSSPGDIVLDLFLGSGSTLLASEQLNRKCYGVEIEPKYVAVTLERWHEMTGEMPEII